MDWMHNFIVISGPLRTEVRRKLPMPEQHHPAAPAQEHPAREVSAPEETPVPAETTVSAPESVPAPPEQALADREQALGAQELALAQREAAIRDREEALARREEELKIKESSLEKQEKSLRESAVPIPEMPRKTADLTAQMNEITKRFNELLSQTQLARNEIRDLRGNVVGWHRNSIADLCGLCRDMMLSSDPGLHAWAQRLDRILEEEFQTESLLPRPGETFDPTCHKRLSLALTGSRIRRCRAKGWKREGEVLLHAVVETD